MRARRRPVRFVSQGVAHRASRIHLIHPTPTQGSGEDEEGDVSDIAKVLEEKRSDIFARYRFTKKARSESRGRVLSFSEPTRGHSIHRSTSSLLWTHMQCGKRRRTRYSARRGTAAACSGESSLRRTRKGSCTRFVLAVRVRFLPLKALVIERILAEYYDVFQNRSAARFAPRTRFDRSRAEPRRNGGRLRATRGSRVCRRNHQRARVVGHRSGNVDRQGSNRDGVARFLDEVAVVFRDTMAADPDLYVNISGGQGDRRSCKEVGTSLDTGRHRTNFPGEGRYIARQLQRRLHTGRPLSEPEKDAVDTDMKTDVLPHDGDRLRQRASSPGYRIRENRRGLPCSLQTADRFRHVLPDGNRRAQHQCRERGAETRQGAQGLTDEWRVQFERTWEALHLSYDQFVRTTDPSHLEAVQHIFKRIHDNGYIFEGEYEGLYCEGCEEFKVEKDLVDGKCPRHNVEVKVIKEKNYFFKLSEFAEPLKRRIWKMRTSYGRRSGETKSSR